MSRLIFSLIFILFFGASVSASEWSPYHSENKANMRVIDGDTVAIRGKPMRVFGIQAPETHRVCAEEIAVGKQAKAKGEELLSQANSVRVKYKRVRSRQTKKLVRARDRYGRSLGSITVDKQDWAGVMLNAGFAKPWDGLGKKPSWCQ